MWTDYWPIILLHVEYDRQLAWYCRLSDEVYCVLKIGVYGFKVVSLFPRGGGLSIHLSWHFCSRMYRSATTNCEIQTDKISAYVM